jgi:hypothetical protein
MADEMIVLTRVYELLAWLLPKGEGFPRVYRHTVTQRLMDSALDLQDGLFLAQTRRGAARRTVLADCDAALSRLRLAHPSPSRVIPSLIKDSPKP